MSKILYTAHAKAIGGRNGYAKTDDDVLKLDLASPGAPNAKPGSTNPEQLFACGYAACFGSALEAAGKQQNIATIDAQVQADVSLHKDDSGFFISVTLNVSLPGIATNAASKLVEAAHQICPYSKATRGNIKVTLKVNDQPLEMAA